MVRFYSNKTFNNETNCILQGQEYAEQYTLEYQRVLGDEKWIKYRSRRGEEVGGTTHVAGLSA